MKKKVKIIVGGTEYTLVTQEEPEYTQKLAEEVNDIIEDMCVNGRISITAAAILTAVNFCDRLKKYEKEADELGEQIEKYLQAAAEQMSKYDDLQRENEKLKKDIETYKKRLTEAISSEDPLSQSVKSAQTVVSTNFEDGADEDETAFFKAIK